MEANHVPHAYPKRQNEDQPHVSAFLYQRSIEVHRPVLLVDDYWWHLDLGPLYNEISQHLGLDGRLEAYEMPYPISLSAHFTILPMAS